MTEQNAILLHIVTDANAEAGISLTRQIANKTIKIRDGNLQVLTGNCAYHGGQAKVTLPAEVQPSL